MSAPGSKLALVLPSLNEYLQTFSLSNYNKSIYFIRSQFLHLIVHGSMVDTQMASYSAKPYLTRLGLVDGF